MEELCVSLSFFLGLVDPPTGSYRSTKGPPARRAMRAVFPVYPSLPCLHLLHLCHGGVPHGMAEGGVGGGVRPV